MGWVRVAGYKDVDCVGCTCCFVTIIGHVDTPLCAECEFQADHPEIDFQVECLSDDCNVYKVIGGNS